MSPLRIIKARRRPFSHPYGEGRIHEYVLELHTVFSELPATLLFIDQGDSLHTRIEASRAGLVNLFLPSDKWLVPSSRSL